MLAISLLMAVAATSCAVHEWPEPPKPAKPVPFRLLLDIDRTIEDYKVVEHNKDKYSNDLITAESSSTHDLRYIVNVYNYPGYGDLDRTVIAQYIFTKDEIVNPDYMAEIELVPGKYRIMVWADHVLQGSVEDNFYKASDFAAIILREGKHSGCDEMRDAYIGQLDFEIVDPNSVDVDEYIANGGVVEDDGSVDVERINDIAIELTRPMAKYQFISTGLDKFISRMQQRKYDKMVANGEETKGDSSRIEVDLNDYTVKMYYASFMPEEFNMYQDWVGWSRIGVSYTSKLTQLSASEALLGFDYVFANGGNETNIYISLEVLDEDGEVVASLAKFATPLMRNKFTTVRGDFLLSKAEGSIGISPGFEDEFIVPVD